MKKRTVQFTALALCVGVMAVFGTGGNVTATSASIAHESAAALTVESDSLRLSLDTETGALCVTDKRSQKQWYSNPVDAAQDENASGVTRTNLLSQLIVKYKDGNSIIAVNNYAGSIKNDGAAFSASGNTIRADYTFKKADITVPVIYSVADGVFSAEILLEEVEERGDCLIHTIELLPFFGAGGLQDEGYLFVPDGAGALMDFNNGKSDYSQYEKPVYGEDTTLLSDSFSLNSEAIRIPVFGMKNGDSAYAAYIRSGAESATIAAAVSGFLCSYNRVSSAVTYRSVETLDLKDHTGKNVTGTFTALNPIATSRYTVEYTFLNGDAADVAGMAAVVRSQLAEQRKTIAPKERLVVDFYGATRVEKAFLGIRYTGVRPLTTYAQAGEILKDLKAAGIPTIDAGYRDAAPGVVSGGLAVDLKSWGKLGGAKQLETLRQYAADNGIQLYTYADYQRYAKSSGGFFRLTDSAMGLDLVPVKLYGYSSVTRAQDKTTRATYLLSPKRFASAGEKLCRSAAANNIGGLLLDRVTDSLYSDFSKNGALRDRALAETVQILEKLSAQTELMLASPNFYAYPYATVITDLPMRSSGCRVFDRDVPFMQMVLHGLVDYTGAAVNRNGITETEILDTISTGGQLKFALMGASAEAVVNTQLDDLYCAEYGVCAPMVKTLYAKVAAVYRMVSDACISSYVRNGQTVCTGYDNGVRVVVNYGDSPVEFEGKTVQSHDCLVIT